MRLTVLDRQKRRLSNQSANQAFADRFQITCYKRRTRALRYHFGAAIDRLELITDFIDEAARRAGAGFILIRS